MIEIVPSLQQAQHFLKILHEGQERFTFQTFDDDKDRRKTYVNGKKDPFAKVFNGTIDDHFQALVKLNSQGAGVFFTVNETNLTGRKLENMLRPRAVFQEADRPATPEPPLSPHIQVESSPGKFHRYLLIDDSEKAPWSEWDGVMRRMITEHGSDPNAKDRARVLRLPGFYHMKNPAAPYMVCIVAESAELPYKWSKIIDAIPPMDEPDFDGMASAPGRGLREPLILSSALAAISADCDYADWLQILMGIHHASGGSGEGLTIADEWSQTGRDYKKGEVASKWPGFGKYTGSPVTEASVYSSAIAAGWNREKAYNNLYPKALEIAECAIAAVASDPTAHLVPKVLEAFKIIRDIDPIEYERIRTMMKSSNTKVRLGALDKFTKSSNGQGGDEKQSVAAALAEMAAGRCELFHDADGNGYASFMRGDEREHRECWRLDSSGFKEWLGYLAHVELEESPSSEAIRSAINTLTGIAKFDGEELQVFARVAKTDAGYWIDLGDEEWRSILVTATGWQITSSAPVKFVRSKSTRPLPTPLSGGRVDDLWTMVNIPEADRPLVLAFMLECFRPDTAYPVLEFMGEHGGAKSTTQETLRLFVDNSKVMLRGRPKTVEDIFVAAGQNHVVSYENLSSLTPEMSDAFCSISTGAGYAGRQLYTNGEEATIEAKNPIMLNGIGAVVVRPDLLDRTISVIVPVIKERKRDAELDALLEKYQNSIMGGLLDLFVMSLAKLPDVSIEPNELPRMADFAYLGEAMSQSMGYDPGVWLKLYTDHRRDTVRRTIDANPVAVAIIQFVNDGKRHAGTVKALLELLNAQDILLERSDYWPRSPKGMADSLRRVAPPLRQMGIAVSIEAKPRRDGVHCLIERCELGKPSVFKNPTKSTGGNTHSPSSPSSQYPQQGRRESARL